MDIYQQNACRSLFPSDLFTDLFRPLSGPNTSMRFPDFFIIGAMKAATSTLHEQLSAQPGISMSQPKELYFFSDDAVWAKGTSWYASHFDAVAPTDLCGESSTHYSKLPTYPKTIERLAATVENPRLIYVMRHPIDRLVSQYQHMQLQGEVHEALEDVLSGNHSELIDYSCYSKQLLPYLTRFGPDAVLPVFFDRLVDNPQAELERVCSFLDYPGTPVWDATLQHNVTTERLAVSTVRERIKSAPFYSLLRRLTPETVVNGIRKQWRAGPKPVLSSGSLAAVTKIFNRDLEQLGSWLDTPLDCSNFVQVTGSLSPSWIDGLQERLRLEISTNLAAP